MRFTRIIVPIVLTAHARFVIFCNVDVEWVEGRVERVAGVEDLHVLRCVMLRK